MVQQQQVREGVSAATDASLPAVYKWLEEQGSANAEMRAYRDAELKLVRETNLTIVVSEQEQSAIHRYLPGAPVHVVSLIMPEMSRPVFPCAQRQGLLFVGSLGHPPNAQVSCQAACRARDHMLCCLYNECTPYRQDFQRQRRRCSHICTDCGPAFTFHTCHGSCGIHLCDVSSFGF